MCTKKQYLFVVCGHTEWCESQCQTKLKRTLMNPKDEKYPPPCIPVTEVTDPIRLVGKCSTCRPRTRSARSAFGTTSATSASERDAEGSLEVGCRLRLWWKKLTWTW
ncbi:hypothetical protein NEUTE1DRAFT_34114 [Neurospora tetrasperma FGSC 2508]|uniref:Uncharacterized protein n=1 Tax=Neurospora tetrasperma (strain FGSC 2508 / ATCC MYA-4615 / P0657) TaxID=510951 RepID=F8ME44_NEUT8|nr:uncharacterized protein NEUTE1DRAFT_34114 [Neurospora tetrasperma FGSC 2508]EGO61579.1 hypothetical protein NEUTE1DRAFT_34114 [Neurospora tetrasperma FGSC 2508]EGZ74377.1 hypothetical protein NEUTE2DRAFT_55596 [Neurospora tetrasperma FGSC 2509]